MSDNKKNDANLNNNTSTCGKKPAKTTQHKTPKSGENIAEFASMRLDNPETPCYGSGEDAVPIPLSPGEEKSIHQLICWAIEEEWNNRPIGSSLQLCYSGSSQTI